MIDNPQITIERVAKFAKQFQSVLDLAEIFKNWQDVERQISEAGHRLDEAKRAVASKEAERDVLAIEIADARKSSQEKSARSLASAEAKANAIALKAEHDAAAIVAQAQANADSIKRQSQGLHDEAQKRFAAAEVVTMDADARKAGLLSEIKQLEQRLAAVKAAIKSAVEVD